MVRSDLVAQFHFDLQVAVAAFETLAWSRAAALVGAQRCALVLEPLRARSPKSSAMPLSSLASSGSAQIARSTGLLAVAQSTRGAGATICPTEAITAARRK